MKQLRAETREQHEELESALPLGDACLSVENYTRLLTRFWGFYQTWEVKAAAMAPEHLQTLLAGRRKLPLLAADLQALQPGEHAARPSLNPGWLPTMEMEAGLLGSMYVVEGATLGGQVIARQLERELHLNGGHGYSFFQSYGKAVGQQWKEFSAIANAMPETAAPAMIEAARDTFTAFHRWFAALAEDTRA